VAQGQPPSLVVEADAHRVDLRTLLRGRQHVLEAILDPPHGAAEAQGKEWNEHVLEIDDELGTESAADVRGHHTHAVRWQAEEIAAELPHLVWDLGRRPHREE